MDEDKQESVEVTEVTNAETAKVDVAKSSKPKNEKKAKRSGLKTKIQEVKGEFRKIIWPTRRELVKQTVTVIITCAVFGVIIVSMDAGYSALLSAFTTLVSGS